ncbi:alkaline phosphatase family protein [Larkinella sp. VNQ87]|uniref:alkaline phosphatase family protein n=1 Tax=Larkinella sp. VNQ87 TaxID=3400921 RepID=UPI003C0C7606
MKDLYSRSCLLCLLLILVAGTSRAQNRTTSHQTENVILITLDGVRWQEVFAGADSTLLFDPVYSPDTADARRKFWARTPTERRKRLMPFFWNILVTQGQLYGNRLKDSKVNVSNPYWFSYPGYNEILAGYADERINSNDKKNNPNTTVLEFLNQQPGLKGKVAVFSSWNVIEAAVNEERSGIYANSALEPIAPVRSETDSLLNHMMKNIESDFAGVRPDFLTYYAALNYLKRQQPRALFISFDETDDLAHAGRYADHLRMLQTLDRLMGDLWTTLQQLPQYRNKTSLLITTDHGRGHTPKARWKDHGTKTPDSYQMWLAALGPDTPPTGEQSGGPVLFQNQIAATLARLMGYEFRCEHPVGPPIPAVLKP